MSHNVIPVPEPGMAWGNALKGGYKEYFLDEDFTQQQFDMEFGGDATYPQIQINAKHIGNLKDTLHYLQDCGKI